MLLKKVIIPDKKIKFPKSAEEARQIIEETFKAKGNEWDEILQTLYFASLGINKEKLGEMDQKEIRQIFNDLLNNRMILVEV